MPDAAFTFRLDAALAPEEAWRRLADVSRHGEVVPLTRGSGPAPDEVEVGSRFVARTALGPFGFDDVMVVRETVPGRRLVLEKTGRMLGGTVTVDIAPRPAAADAMPTSAAPTTGPGSVVAWHQSVVFPWLPGPTRRLAGLAVPLLAVGYRTTVRRLLA